MSNNTPGVTDPLFIIEESVNEHVLIGILKEASINVAYDYHDGIYRLVGKLTLPSFTLGGKKCALVNATEAWFMVHYENFAGATPSVKINRKYPIKYIFTPKAEKLWDAWCSNARYKFEAMLKEI